MAQRLLFRLVTSCLIVAFCPWMACGEETASATVLVTAPPDALLYFNGKLTGQRGVLRRFTTPELSYGKEYVYDVRVDISHYRQPVIARTKEITVRAGMITRVYFDERELSAELAEANRIRFKHQHGGSHTQCTEAFSPDKRTVVRVRTEEDSPRAPKSVRLYDAKSDKPLGPRIHLPRSAWGVTGLAIAPDGKTVAIGVADAPKSGAGYAEVWDATMGTRLARYWQLPYLGDAVNVSFSADGRTVTVCTNESSGK
ncbi:MAG TPA: TIGR03000 domain-containing protein [Gemmataceae bacterium]|nr:TIGR03000 domain-containing protein [Gemmataceae bacterium]